MKNIIFNEWKSFFRNKTFVYTTVFFVFSLSTVVWMGIIQSDKHREKQEIAQKHVRQQWDNLENINPHQAAHYGLYAFKPINVLGSIDEGINLITGNVLKLEGHVQNEILYSDASQSLTVSKFGKLKSSLLLQYVIPLLLIFLTYSSVTNEKETGRLKLILFQGFSYSKLILAKSISVWAYGLFLMLVTIFAQVIFGEMNKDILDRIILLFISYGSYYYVIVSMATYFSARFKSNTSALSAILATWIIWTIFLPKIWGNAVENIHSLPNRNTFKAAMREDRSKGIDGHNPSDKRRDELKNRYLAKYQVDSLSQLPINFDGIVMQEDEEYGNRVWDKHFGEKYRILQKQKSLYQLSGIINPFASIQSTGMGFCGNDMIHHLDFLKKSEDYRRYLIKALNDEHAYGGSKTGNWKWTVDKTFFKSIDNFYYEPPKISSVSGNYTIDIFFTLWWVVLMTIIVKFSKYKNILE